MPPWVVEKKMRKDLEATLKYLRRLWTRITLERLTNNTIGTNSVRRFAIQEGNYNKTKNEYLKFIKSNMTIKLEDAISKEKEAKKDMIQERIELKKFVNMNSIAGEEYQTYVDAEWNKN